MQTTNFVFTVFNKWINKNGMEYTAWLETPLRTPIKYIFKKKCSLCSLKSNIELLS